MRIQLFVAAALLLIAASPSHGVTTLRRATVQCGATDGASAHHRIRTTAGQMVVAMGASAHHVIHSGFWWPGQFPSAIEDERGLPSDFALRSVSPNPFSNSTEIRFDVPAGGGDVSLRVYDIAGRLVRELTRGTHPPGSQQILWNGTDDSGRRVGSGLYLLAFAASGQESTRKLVLLP
jgi:hypothetical protein